MYRHSLRYQQFLQKAMKVHLKLKGVTESSIIANSEVECSKSTLNRFRNADLSLNPNSPYPEKQLDAPIRRSGGVFLNVSDATALWKYLEDQAVFEQMFETNEIKKTDLISNAIAAEAMQTFFGVKKAANKQFDSAGLAGVFFCYKPSFRREGFTVKAKMEFTLVGDDFFEVTETQITSGRFELDRAEIIEKSTGFGFIKTGRLWIFLRDVETEQPRIFCFHQPKFSHPQNGDDKENPNPSNSIVYSWFGYLIEGAKGNQNSAFTFNAVLNASPVERIIWEDAFDKDPKDIFNLDDQIEVLPTAKAQRKLYKKQLKGLEIAVPVQVKLWLEDGIVADG